MIRRQRSSTRFPYTTLFRSAAAGVEDRPLRDARPAALRGEGEGPLRRVRGPLRQRRPGRREAAVSGRSGADRKSTRLNPSHSQISYAVFCLKKKNELRAIQDFA